MGSTNHSDNLRTVSFLIRGSRALFFLGFLIVEAGLSLLYLYGIDNYSYVGFLDSCCVKCYFS